MSVWASVTRVARKLQAAVAWLWPWLCLPAFAAGLGVLGWRLWDEARDTTRGTVAQARNFYGVLRVVEYDADDPELAHLLLRHGRISHGCQFTSEDRRSQPTTYYGEDSPYATYQSVPALLLQPFPVATMTLPRSTATPRPTANGQPQGSLLTTDY